MSKWVAQIDDAARIPEYVSRAFHVATSGRPGPVVLALPEDMLRDKVEVADPHPYARVESHPGSEDMAKLRDMLSSAKRPLVILGGGGWNAEAYEARRSICRRQRLARRNVLPAAGLFRQ